MKKLFKLGDTLFVEKHVLPDKVLIYYIDDFRRIIACNLPNDDERSYTFKNNDDYIIVYSEEKYSISSRVKLISAYSIKDGCLVNISNPLKEYFFLNLFIYKKNFSFKCVLTEINESRLDILREENKYELSNYLTMNNNEKISKKEIVDYIINCYPMLEGYMRLHGPISFNEFEELRKNFDDYEFSFHIMPQCINYIN